MSLTKITSCSFEGMEESCTHRRSTGSQQCIRLTSPLSTSSYRSHVILAFSSHWWKDYALKQPEEKMPRRSLLLNTEGLSVHLGHSVPHCSAHRALGTLILSSYPNITFFTLLNNSYACLMAPCYLFWWVNYSWLDHAIGSLRLLWLFQKLNNARSDILTYWAELLPTWHKPKSSGKKESHLRNCPHESGLQASLWMTDMGGWRPPWAAPLPGGCSRYMRGRVLQVYEKALRSNQPATPPRSTQGLLPCLYPKFLPCFPFMKDGKL